MTTTAGVNWGKLVEQNRAKSVGVPWRKEDRKAIKAGIPPDYVRKGILTQEDYETELAKEAKETPETPEADSEVKDEKPEEKPAEEPQPTTPTPPEKVDKVGLSELPKDKSERYKYKNLTKLSTQDLIKVGRDELGLTDLTGDVPRADVLQFIAEAVAKQA